MGMLHSQTTEGRDSTSGTTCLLQLGGRFWLKLEHKSLIAMLRGCISRTNVPVAPEDLRRLDLIAPGFNVCRGLPLFCDATVLGPIAATGLARPGTSNQGGQLLANAEEDNNDIYWDVISTGLGELLCLGCEVYGRWGRQCVDLVPKLARERTRGLHVRVRRGMALSLQHRWCAILGLAVQKSVAHVVLSSPAGVDLLATGLEPAPALADLT